MDFARTDLLLAIAHHLLVFSLAGIVAYEIAVVHVGITAPQIRRLARVDIWYGILAALILAVGFSRAVFAAKGWAYYSANHFFWAKIGTFAVVGLLSVVPTLRFVRWNRAAKAGTLPDAGQVRGVRVFLWLEALGLGIILACAAAMARGYGMPQ